MGVDGHVVTINGTEMSLTVTEFRLLELLLRNAGQVLTRAQLIDQVWGPRQVAGTRILDITSTDSDQRSNRTRRHLVTSKQYAASATNSCPDPGARTRRRGPREPSLSPYRNTRLSTTSGKSAI
jgi:Transcriptional regulatory protein, C terminal